MSFLRQFIPLTAFQALPGGPSDQILDRLDPVLDAGGNPECSEKNLRKQVWTGNQVHVSAGTGDRTRDSLVQIEEIRCANLLLCIYFDLSKTIRCR